MLTSRASRLASIAATALLASACVGSPSAPPPVRAISPTATRAPEVVATAPADAVPPPASTPTATPTPSPTSTPQTATPTATPTSTSTPVATAAPFPNFTPDTGNPTRDASGNALFWPRTYADGPGEFRLGGSDWFIELPAGARLWWEFGPLGEANSSARIGWFDTSSGSLLVVNARDLTEIERVMQGDPATRDRAGRAFDAIVRSVSRQVPEN